MVGVAYFEGNGQRQARGTLAGLCDHDRIGVDPNDPSLRRYPLGESACLVPESASHIEDLISFPDRASIQHLPLYLLDQGIPVHAVQPGEDGLAPVKRVTCRLETLMQAAHGAPRRRWKLWPNSK